MHVLLFGFKIEIRSPIWACTKGNFAFHLANEYPQLAFSIHGYEPDCRRFDEASRNARGVTRKCKKIIMVTVENMAVAREAGREPFISEPSDSWRCCLLLNGSEAKRQTLTIKLAGGDFPRSGI